MENLWEAGVALASVAYSLIQFWKYWQSRKIEAEAKGQNIISSAIGAAVNAVYGELVRKWKADGAKLTDDQRSQALKLAADYAKQIAASKGVNLEGKLAPEELLDYIERVVQVRKMK